MAKLTTSAKSQTPRFAGIDYHKKFSIVCLGNKHGEELEQHKLWHDDVPSVKKFFRKHSDIKFAIESCRGYEWLLDLLRGLGIEVHVCNQHRMKIISQTAFKNDKIDSRKIMELLAKDYLPKSYQATPIERELRERIRWRARLVQKTTSIKNSIKAVLAKENISIKDPYSKKGQSSLAKCDISKAHRQLLSDMFDAHLGLQSAVQQQTEWINQNTKADRRVQLLKTIPGFGDISAFAYLAEVGDIKRFPSAAQVSSYFGLVPKLDESADKRRLGRITKEGSPLIRAIMVQDAWHALRTSPELRRRYLNISRRRGKQIAIVAIARTLVEIAYCVLRDKCPFSEKKLANKNDR